MTLSTDGKDVRVLKKQKDSPYLQPKTIYSKE